MNNPLRYDLGHITSTFESMRTHRKANLLLSQEQPTLEEDEAHLDLMQASVSQRHLP